MLSFDASHMMFDDEVILTSQTRSPKAGRQSSFRSS